METGVETLVPPDNPKRKNPWGVAPTLTSTPCSLAAVMDEQLARELQDKEEDIYKQELSGHTKLPVFSTQVEGPDTSNDLLLAQMLQLEFDRQHDRLVGAEERVYNRDSKVRVSFENFRSLPRSFLEDEVEEESEEEEEEDMLPQLHHGSHGRRRSKGVPTGGATKHDPVICGRKNVRNMEKFPPDFPCGDIGDANQDFRLPNSVYNTLREHSFKEEKQAQRLHEKKEHSTQEQALDPKTRLLLFKMVDSGMLTEINGCISTGKEACVYHAEGGSLEGQTIPPECAIKVFKTTLNEFKNRDRYIKDDYRFKDRFGKQNPRKVVKLWAEKEMHNLKRLQEKGIPCPEVVLLRKHILVMSFIGEDCKPAPELKEAQLSPELMTSAYQQCIHGMQRMYSVCHLIHADLSEYNMLWHQGKVHFIDVSQSVEPSHPHGLEFLLRDCRNVSNFFSRSGVADVMGPHQLFNYVSGLDIKAQSDQEFLAQIRMHRKREHLLQTMHSKTEPYPFDYFFEQTTRSGSGTGQHESSSSSDSDS